MTNQPNSQERCPRCGSRELEHERVRSQGIRIVSCLDCNAVFQLRASTKSAAPPPRRREPDPIDDDREEEVDSYDR